ncbi:flagellar assembly factor FliW [Microbacterium sp. W4I4]|uniref:flagellar assembly protein FliW n=1 Tax=Microbacterium sp. W4I4 TaxID=3042295 RepID=UPI00278072B8|nr:flagellar assembly protein FliW [Microbacterium sp. W4I4]MDQ0613706.1 flagellar assembly factor FliW [Microbacterium sp. W4I4]
MSVVLTFVTPPPGFAPHTRFLLEPVADADGLFSLDAVDDQALRLHVVESRRVAADYAPTISDSDVRALGLTGPEQAMLLLVVGHTSDGVHVNLLAPIVVNSATGACAQLILDDQDLPLRALLA